MIDDKLRERVHLWLEKKPRKNARPHHCFSQMGLWVRDEDEWEIVRQGVFEDLLAAALKKLDKKRFHPQITFEIDETTCWAICDDSFEDGDSLLAALYALLDRIRESEK